LLFVTILGLLISFFVVTYKKRRRQVWLLIKNLKRSTGWSERYKEKKDSRHKTLKGFEKENGAGKE
jgi:hypothetical protein